MKEYKILAIGNSFSEDAFYYLHGLAKADLMDVLAVNLFIGGCSLAQHWENVCMEEKSYMYQKNGILTERFVSIREILREERWDIIMTQQASHDSGFFHTYFPWLTDLVSLFRRECPGADLYLHQTWAYETDSSHGAFSLYDNSQVQMYEKLHSCYKEAAKTAGLSLIPTGEVIQALRETKPFRYEAGGLSLCRDGFHLDMIYGRYAAAGCLYTTFFKKDIRDNQFCPAGAKNETLDVIKECIYKVAEGKYE